MAEIREDILRLSRRIKEETDGLKQALKMADNKRHKLEVLNVELLELLNKLEVTK